MQVKIKHFTKKHHKAKFNTSKLILPKIFKTTWSNFKSNKYT